MKGFKAVLVKILTTIGVKGTEDLSNLCDFQIKTQNLQSSSCIKALGSFIRNKKKTINADDLTNPIDTYETTFEFLEEDITRYRNQGIKHECFAVLHPWAYDLNKVDFKYIMNNDLTEKVCAALKTQNSQIFWLSFFKAQAAVSADDFFGALRELANLNKIPQFYDANLASYQQSAIDHDFVFSLNEHASEIMTMVQQVADAGQTVGYNALRDQVKTYSGSYGGSNALLGQMP